ncbi:flavoprotein [Candidatus Omnitrophota bacterium]
MAKQKEIIVGITGSIAAYKSCELIRHLKEGGFGISVVMTDDAEKFVSALTFQTLSRNRVYRGLFNVAADEYDSEHVSLARKADLILIVPATANIIGKIASGIADDLLTCTVIAAACPTLIAPAMHDNMYRNKIVQDNIRKLKSAGYVFVGPTKGKLADGKSGIGRLADIDAIVKEARKFLTK